MYTYTKSRNNAKLLIGFNIALFLFSIVIFIKGNYKYEENQEITAKSFKRQILISDSIQHVFMNYSLIRNAIKQDSLGLKVYDETIGNSVKDSLTREISKEDSLALKYNEIIKEPLQDNLAVIKEGFFCLSVIIFMLIWMRIQAIAYDPRKKLQIAKPSKLLKGWPDLSLPCLSIAVTVWAIVNLIRLAWTGPSGDPQLVMYSSIFSTLNNAFLLLSTLDFDYDEKPPTTKLWNWTTIGGALQTPKGIAIGSILAILSYFLVNIPVSNGHNDQFVWPRLGEIIFSTLTLGVLGASLSTIFRNREIQWTIVIIKCILVFAFVFQWIHFFRYDDNSTMENASSVIGGLYPTTLLAVYMVLAFSWLDLIKRRNMEVVNQQLAAANKLNIALKREQSHRIKNSLLTLSIKTDKEMRKVSHPDSLSGFKAIQTHISVLLNLHELLDRKEKDELDKEIFSQYIENVLQKLNKILDFTLYFSHVKLDYIHEIRVPDAKAIAQVLAELILNVYKHAYSEESDHKSIKIRVFDTPDTLILEVADQGNGMKEEASGRGLELIKKMLAPYHAQTNFFNSSKGLTITVNIPINKISKFT